jgi:hypothetical protein
MSEDKWKKVKHDRFKLRNDLKIQRKKSVYALCKEIIPWSWAFLKEVPLASTWSECLFLEQPAPGLLPYIETSLSIKFIVH